MRVFINMTTRVPRPPARAPAARARSVPRSRAHAARSCSARLSIPPRITLHASLPWFLVAGASIYRYLLYTVCVISAKTRKHCHDASRATFVLSCRAKGRGQGAGAPASDWGYVQRAQAHTCGCGDARAHHPVHHARGCVCRSPSPGGEMFPQYCLF